MMKPWYRRGLATIGALLMLVLLLPGSSPSRANADSSYGGSLTILGANGIPGMLNCNPFLPGESLTGTQGMIYETLLFFNQMQGGKITPWLATGYRFSSDATSVTFTLRSGVKWSDGQDFTSADVVFTLTLLKRYPVLDTAGLWKVITSVSAPDKQTVVVTFNQPSVPILWPLAGQTFIVPEHLWKNVADPTTYDNPRPVGTGPFLLKGFTTTVEYVLTRNPHYWQPDKPSIAQIIYELPHGGLADTPLVPPGWDWLGYAVPNIEQMLAQQDPAHNRDWFPPIAVTMLYLNLTKAPFNQLAVRQAISAAIDRRALSTQAEYGSEPVASPTALLLPANQRFLAPQYQHTTFGTAEPARAAAILQAAGFKKGSDGVYADAAGHRLAFTLNVPLGWSDWDTIAQMIAGYLNTLGMDVTVHQLEYQDYLTALTNATFDAALAWTDAGPTPYYLYHSLLASSIAPSGLASSINWERWSNPVTDQLLQAYAQSPDANIQQQAIVGLEQIMVEQLPAIPLLDEVDYAAYSTARFVGWPDAANPYALPSPLNSPDAEIVALTLHAT